MYKFMMVPVDLSHADKLDKALATAAAIAKEFDVKVCFVGVTATAPSAIAHTPEEYKQKLEAFAAEQASKLGIEAQAKAVTCADPATDLDDVLDKTAHELGVDLVVMASHVPGFREHLFNSNAGYLASHSDISVMVVR